MAVEVASKHVSFAESELHGKQNSAHHGKEAPAIVTECSKEPPILDLVKANKLHKKNSHSSCAHVMPRFRVTHSRPNVRGLKKEENSKVLLLYSDPKLHQPAFSDFVRNIGNNKLQ